MFFYNLDYIKTQPIIVCCLIEAASELASITMAGAQFLTLLQSSSRSSLFKPSRPFFYNPIKNYGEASNGKQSRLMEKRAPSTAEEFQRVAEEKAQQEVASQTVDKTYDGAEEATKGNSRNEAVKDRNKEHEPGSDYHRKGN